MGSPEQISQVEDIRYVHGAMPVNFAYTVGVAGERFFREIMENGRFLGTRCQHCQYTYLPPRLYCERCFASLNDQWVEVSSRGSVEAFTIAHLDLDGQPLAEPQLLALIRLEGADGLLVHRLGGVRAEDVDIGLSVVAVFRPRRQRKGSILDIQHFKPATS
ncbi:MAG: Zn-ribbon domain-containing OB-fold protein [Dehalococcoidia bacterium]|nr:Zn-ribbon domain-containing OB-fold protein [Dehalococcoidia bacterium]